MPRGRNSDVLEDGIGAHIGYSREYDYLTGKRVRVPAGVPIHDMHPQKPLWSRSARTQSVVVEHVLPGTSDSENCPVRDPMVRWAGSGGYWRGAPADLVEVVGE